MIFKVNWIEVKKSAKGTWYAKADIEGEGEVMLFEKDWGDMKGITPGSEIDGVMGKMPDGKKVLNKGNMAKFGKNPFKAEQIEKAQERKAEYIEKAQDRKADQIAYFNAINSAIAMLQTDKGPALGTDEQYHEFIRDWRDWFLDEWNKYNSDDSKHGREIDKVIS